MQELAPTNPSGAATASEDVLYSINATVQSARIPDDVWKDLSQEARKAWTSLPATARTSILEAGHSRKVHMAVTGDLLDLDTRTDTVSDPGLAVHATKATGARKKTSFASAQDRASALNSAQAGDPRKVLADPSPDFP